MITVPYGILDSANSTDGRNDDQGRRFNKESLIVRINAIANLKDQIILTNFDAVDFINLVLPNT